MNRVTGFAVACLMSMVAAGPLAAKNDIRGIVTAQRLQEAMDTLDLDGAQCRPAIGHEPVVCDYGDHNSLTLYHGGAPADAVEKIVYTFKFTDLAATRDKLQQLYGLRKDRIEGEHKLFTGERLLIELDKAGKGSLSIINDAQIRRDGTAAR